MKRLALMCAVVQLAAQAAPPTINGNPLTIEAKPAALARLRPRLTSPQHVVLRLDARQVDERGASFPGVQFVEPIDSFHVIAILTSANIVTIGTDPRISGVAAFSPRDRLTAGTDPRKPPSHAMRSGGLAEYSIVFFADVLRTDAIAAVATSGGVAAAPNELEFRTLHSVRATLSPQSVARLAADDRVRRISFVPGPQQPMNQTSQAAARVDIVQAAPLSLDGTGQTVAVFEISTVPCWHTTFGARCTVISTGATDSIDHAAHVAGTVGGSTAFSAQSEGMAPSVTLRTYAAEDDDNQLASAGPHAASSHSYGLAIGDDGGAAFTAFGQYNDDAMWNDMNGFVGRVIVWAAGNDRDDTRWDGTLECAGGYNCMSPEGSAKNVITVGAMRWTAAGGFTNSTFSGWGPTQAGRLKPDVVTRGEAVVSAAADGGVTTMGGTSMATPAVSGSIALLQQLAAQGGATLTPEDLRAVLFHTADNTVGVAGPDYQTGWGAVQIDRAAEVVRGATSCIVRRTVQPRQTTAIEFCVPPNTPSIQATVAWRDLWLEPLAIDYDLELISPAQARVGPLVLNPLQPAAAAVSTPGQFDRVNTAEQVSVTNPEAGRWIARLRRNDALPLPSFPASLILPSCSAPDRDADGIADCADNCPDDRNPTQEDTDGDGRGDTCDADTDEDGVLDAKDNCLYQPNPKQEDTDCDGRGDACDHDPDNDCANPDDCPTVACGTCGCFYDDLITQAHQIIRACQSLGRIDPICMRDGCGGPLDPLRLSGPSMERMGIKQTGTNKFKLPSLGTRVLPTFSPNCQFVARDLGRIGGLMDARERLCAQRAAQAASSCLRGCPRPGVDAGIFDQCR